MNARMQSFALALAMLMSCAHGQAQTVVVMPRPVIYRSGVRFAVRHPQPVYRWHRNRPFRKRVIVYHPISGTVQMRALAARAAVRGSERPSTGRSTGNGMRMWYDPAGRRPPVYSDHNPFPRTGSPEFVPNRGGMDGMEIQARERTAVGQAQAAATMATTPHAGGYRLWYDPSGRRPPVYSNHNPF